MAACRHASHGHQAELTMLEALIFDVDGTLADTEMVHLAAFNQAFSSLGLPWHWDVPTYIQLLEVSGGKERMRAYWNERAEQVPQIDSSRIEELIERLHAIKTTAYEHAVSQGRVQLRAGVLDLLQRARAAGMRLAIATTTSPANVDSLLKHCLGSDWNDYFSVIEDASTAVQKKPDPMVYQHAVQRLQLPAQNCLAFEDSGNGLRAARSAGVAAVVTPTALTAHHDFRSALRILPDLQDIGLKQLRDWHALAGNTD